MLAENVEIVSVECADAPTKMPVPDFAEINSLLVMPPTKV